MPNTSCKALTSVNSCTLREKVLVKNNIDRGALDSLRHFVRILPIHLNQMHVLIHVLVLVLSFATAGVWILLVHSTFDLPECASFMFSQYKDYLLKQLLHVTPLLPGNSTMLVSLSIDEVLVCSPLGHIAIIHYSKLTYSVDWLNLKYLCNRWWHLCWVFAIGFRKQHLTLKQMVKPLKG